MSFGNVRWENENTFQAAPRPGGKLQKALPDLLKDDVFVDFFNTFLNLPVFGQTPLYFLSENKWFMCPEIPQNQEVRRGGYLKWLRAYRFVYFKHTELYHYYSLCKEFLRFSAYQAKEVLKWTSADQWLLKRSLGSARGMRRFCAFVSGTRGEELVMFWVRVERLLQIDRQDVTQQHRYQALLTVIKAIHLREGSNVMATCHTPTDVMLKVSGSQPAGQQEQILAQMRSKALHRLQRYWLPQYLRCVKASLASVEECGTIARAYKDLASCLTPATGPAQVDQESWRLGSGPPEGPTTSRMYRSRVSKRALWRAHLRPGTGKKGRDAGKRVAPTEVCQWLPMEGAGDQGECTNAVHCLRRRAGAGGNNKCRGRSKKAAPLRKVSSVLEHRANSLPPIHPTRSLSGLAIGCSDEATPPHLCLKTPICHFPSVVSLEPPPAPPPAPPCAPRLDEYLCSALSADALAGGPYEAFLRVMGLQVQLRHLGLWQELDSFLILLLKMEDGSFQALRQLMGRKIVSMYLSDGVDGRKCLTALTAATAKRLRGNLASGNVIPWIYAAKQEICQILRPTYDAFLNEDDGQFLFSLFSQTEVWVKVSRWQTVPSSGPNVPEQQLRRMRDALALCQACCGYGDVEPLSQETWALMALEDVRRGGSVHLHFRKTNQFDLPFETLVQKYPKMAVEEISKTYRLYYDWKSVQEITEKPVVTSAPQKKTAPDKKNYSSTQRASMRPRSLAEVMRNPTNLDFFKRYLKANNALGALTFFQEVECLRSIDRLRQQRAKINSIMTRFFRRTDAEDYIQCDANLISQIPKMRYVSPDVLFAAQDLAIKSLEATWFKQYQDTFPPCTDVVDTNMRAAVLTNKLKHVWVVFSRFIKSICKFRSAMKDIPTRSKFEAYLRHNWHEFSPKYGPYMGNRQVESVGLCAEDGDSLQLKRRVVNNKLLTVDFLVNDLSFYLETERKMADSGTMMASAAMYWESDHALLHQKAEMIIKLFLESEMSPRLRINIAESARESIQQSFSMGKVSCGLFHEAIMAIFPNLIFCWKKFCQRNVKKDIGHKDAKKENLAVIPDYLNPFDEGSWYHKIQTTMSLTDGNPTLRFTVDRGLNLVLPQARPNMNVCSSVLSPAKPRQSGYTSVSSEFPSLDMNKSVGPFLSPQTSLPSSDAATSSSGS